MPANDTLELAQALARRGWFVFPCKADKSPIKGFKWTHDSTLNSGMVEEYFDDQPGRLIGIDCKRSGIFAVDIDVKHGKNGIATWQDWTCDQDPLPPTQSTPNGGLHLVFTWPDGLDIPNAVDFAPGIDLRSKGYICTGTGYKWIIPFTVQPPTPPDWLIQRIKGYKPPTMAPEAPQKPVDKQITQKPGKYTSNADKWLQDALQKARPGNRNQTGFDLACQLRDNGISEAEALANPYPDLVQQGDAPYTREEWRESVKSAYARTPRQPARKEHLTPSPDVAGTFTVQNGQTVYHPGTLDPPPDWIAEAMAENGPSWPDEPPEFEDIPLPPGWIVAPKVQAEAMQPRPRYVIHTMAEAMQPRPPIDWMVDGLIARKSVNVFFGESGIGKTYFLIDLAICVAANKPWLNYKTKRSKVLIVDEESGEDRLARRLAEVTRGELADESIPLEYVCMAGWLLDNKVDQILFEAMVENSGADLIIIDALTDIMVGDENKKQDTQPVFTALRKVAEKTNAAIIVIHHTNKMGGYRGSSAIKGALEVLAKITREDDVVKFTTEKTRDGEAQTWAANAIWEDGNFYMTPATVTAEPVALNKAEEFVIDYLTEHGPSTVTDIMSSPVGCTKDTAKTAVYRLARRKQIIRTNPDEAGRGTSAIYALPAI